LYPDEEPGLFDIVVDKFKRLRKLSLPEASGVKLGGFELDPAASGAQLAAVVSQWAKKLADFVDKHIAKNQVSLLVDRLDDGWDATPESKLMLVGVLKAARDLKIKLASSQAGAPVIIFLRSDILAELQFNDKNKMSADIEVLEWDDDRLSKLVSLRIANALNCDPGASWGMVFSSDEMRQRARPKSYILKRTMGKPRDIIAFCIKCQDVAVSAGHSVVQTSDVYEAEKLYSEHIYNELDDEMHKQVPKARDYMQVLRDIAKTRFAMTDWVDACVKRGAASNEAEARERLKLLFDFSIVGVPKIGGAGGGSGYQFNYSSSTVEPNFESNVAVHPSLKSYLQLTEPRGADAD
jgi:hypothetical protein